MKTSYSVCLCVCACAQAQELYQVIEGQNTTLCKLREMAHRSQLQHSQVSILLILSVLLTCYSHLCKILVGAMVFYLISCPTFFSPQLPEGGHLQGEVVALQSSLFRCQLELEANQRAQRQNQRVAEDLAHSRDRLRSDLEAALLHRETTEKYNQVGTNKA